MISGESGAIATLEISHHKINSTEFLDTALDCVFQALEFANVDSANANDPSARADRRNLFRSALGLLYIATDDTGISA